MNSSLLQLEDYGLTDLSIKWEPMDQNPVEAKSSTAITYQVAYQTDNPHKYKLTLEFRHLIGSAEGKDHLSIQASIVGYFLFQETTSLHDRERAIRINGLTILYGALRGLLLPITATFPLGFRYVLPAVDMIQIIKAVEETKKAAPVVRENSAKYRPTSKKAVSARGSKTKKP